MEINNEPFVVKLKKNKNKKTYKYIIPKTKGELVKEILKRWWYGMAEWPENEIDYLKILQEKGYSTEEIKDKKENKKNKKQYINVQELSGYKGIYFDKDGQVIDLRNSNTKPNYENLKMKEISELSNILKKCLKNQIKELRSSKYYEQNLDYALTKFYKKFLKVYADYLKE